MKTTTFVLIVLGLAAALLCGQSTLAASGSIAGRVVLESDNSPAVGYWVEIEGNGIGTITDSLGQFRLSNLKPGRYRLTVTGIGHGTFRDLPGTDVEVLEGRTQSVEIELPVVTSDHDYKNTGAAADQMKVEKESIKGYGGKMTVQEAPGILPRNEVPRAYRKCAPSIAVPAPEPTDRVRRDPRYQPPIFEENGYGFTPRDMYFQDYGTHGFVDTRYDRLSTFAVDVDDASYNIVKSYLERGLMPPSAAVRLEEFVNHFDYGYNPPSDEKFRIFAELTPSPFDPEIVMLKLGIKGREKTRSERVPMNLTLVIDESGSMAEGNRLELVKQAVKTLVKQLDGSDRVGVVAYSTTARVVLDPVPGDKPGVILRAVSDIRPRNRTCAEAGLELGYRMAGRQYVSGHNNLVLLFSDGVANVGHTGPDDIMDQIGRFARGGLVLHTYGVGMGNYNDVLLEQLAQRGNGHYAYLNSMDEVSEQFVREFVAGVETLARDVKIQVEFNDRVVTSYRLLGYENRDVADERFRDNRADGGEIGYGHEVTALYELQLRKSRRNEQLADVHVRWKDREGVEVTETNRVVNLTVQFQPLDNSRPELRLAIASARFAQLLKADQETSDDAYRSLLKLAEPLARELRSGQANELVHLIRTARDLRGNDDYPYERDYISDNYRR